MYEFDAAVTHAINGLSNRNQFADLAMVYVSMIGVPILVLLVAVQWWRRDDRSHVRHVLVASGLSFILGLAINQLILLVVHRIRPYDAGVTHLLIAPSADPSFPSDHATAAFAIAAAFLFHDMHKLGAAFFVAALVVAVSRVFIGTHYVGDVVGGALTGFAAAALVRLVYCEDTALDRAVVKIL